MFVSLKKLLDRANSNGYAVGAFNINSLETLHAVMGAAQITKSPVIIQATEGALEFAGAEYLKALCDVAGRKKGFQVALHLDHGKDLDVIRRCIKDGWTSVMFDGSLLPYKKNVAITKKLVALAHARGVSVEAELGAIKGVEDKVSVKGREAFFTDPAQAKDFVAQTGIDALAISIGTAHGPFKFTDEPQLDLARLAAIKKLVRIPLVLHGASGISLEVLDMLHDHCEDLGDCQRLSGARGVSDSMIKKAIARGINKINIDSDLRIAFVAGFRSALLEKKSAYDPRVLLSEARKEMQAIAVQKMKLFSRGKV